MFAVSLAFDRTTMRLDGGDYDHTYRVAGVHFHWGSDDLQGSEHMIGGKHFPLEVHRLMVDANTTKVLYSAHLLKTKAIADVASSDFIFCLKAYVTRTL